MAMTSANATSLKAAIVAAGFHVIDEADGSVSELVNGTTKVVDTRKLTVCLETDVTATAAASS
jgi:hypothetical protein